MTQQLKFREVATKNAENVERLAAFQSNDGFMERYGGDCLYRYNKEGVYCSIGVALSEATLDEIYEKQLDGFRVDGLIKRNIIAVDDEKSIDVIQSIHDYKMNGVVGALIVFLGVELLASSSGPVCKISFLPQEAVDLIDSIKCPDDLTAAKYTEIMRAIAEHPGDT